jgi:hypothetical protein
VAAINPEFKIFFRKSRSKAENRPILLNQITISSGKIKNQGIQ